MPLTSRTAALLHNCNPCITRLYAKTPTRHVPYPSIPPGATRLRKSTSDSATAITPLAFPRTYSRLDRYRGRVMMRDKNKRDARMEAWLDARLAT